MIKLLHLLTAVFTALFFPALLPAKLIKRFIFETRKANAIREADLLSSETNKQVYVVQYGMIFKVGFRSEFRYSTNKIKSDLSKQNSGFLNYDYRNAIIYKTK